MLMKFLKEAHHANNLKEDDHIASQVEAKLEAQGEAEPGLVDWTSIPLLGRAGPSLLLGAVLPRLLPGDYTASDLKPIHSFVSGWISWLADAVPSVAFGWPYWRAGQSKK